MGNVQNPRLSVGDFVAATNQTLEYAYPQVEVVGEVQGFKVNQGKFVFFDLKDEAASVGCFMTVWQLRTPLEDGMKVVVTATPKLTNWGKFSLTAKQVQLVGEGSLKRSLELLVAKLTKEGLLDESRKRLLPLLPSHIGVIASTGSAGYADFIKILDQRWGGLKIEVAHVQVQGADSPVQIIRALNYFNQSSEPPEVIVIMRGGGSLDDLSGFNDEPLARTIASSRVPTLTGIGHETDTSLADMVADFRASTPTNAAQVLVPDRREIKARLQHRLEHALAVVSRSSETKSAQLQNGLGQILHRLEARTHAVESKFRLMRQALQELNPETVLKRGYAIVRTAQGGLADGSVRSGDTLNIELKSAIIEAGVTNVKNIPSK